jgi:hypothetical protein
MVMSPDGAMIFLQRPVAATLMVASALLLLFVAFKGRAATTPTGGTS